MRNTFSHADRMYGESSQNIFSLLVAWIFRIGVWSLGVYLLLHNDAFIGSNYLRVLGVIVCVFLIQHLCILAVGWVFLHRTKLSNGIGYLEVFRNFMSAMLLLLILVFTHFHLPGLYTICFGVVFAVFSVLVIVKGFQMFYSGLLSVFYILLYFTSLELLPMSGILLWTQHILQ
jgi:hypothetical protein